MQTYTGGCHCGKVRYNVTTELKQVISCNCSLCSKRAHLLSFVPADQFTLIRGEQDLTDYQFNKKIIHHLFCATCGVGSFGRGKGPDGAETIALNVRCLDDVDAEALEIMRFDGKNK